MARRDEQARLNNRGCDFMEAGRLEQARRCFERCGQQNNLRYCLGRLGLLDEAWTAFERGAADGLGHSDGDAVALVALHCASGRPATALGSGLAFLGRPVAYSDDRSRGQLGLITIIAAALTGKADADQLRRIRTLLRSRGRRSVFLAHALKPAFWVGEDDPRVDRRVAVLPEFERSVRRDWAITVAIRDRLLGRPVDLERLVAEPYAWTNDLLLVLQLAPLSPSPAVKKKKKSS